MFKLIDYLVVAFQIRKLKGQGDESIIEGPLLILILTAIGILALIIILSLASQSPIFGGKLETSPLIGQLAKK